MHSGHACWRATTLPGSTAQLHLKPPVLRCGNAVDIDPAWPSHPSCKFLKVQLVPDRVAFVNARDMGSRTTELDIGVGRSNGVCRRGGPFVRHRPNRAASANTGARHSLPARLAANAQPTDRLGRPRQRHLRAGRAGRDAVGMGVADGLRDGRRYSTMRSGLPLILPASSPGWPVRAPEVALV